MVVNTVVFCCAFTVDVVQVRDGSIVSVSSIISAISILSVSYRIGFYNIGFFDISISYR